MEKILIVKQLQISVIVFWEINLMIILLNEISYQMEWSRRGGGGVSQQISCTLLVEFKCEDKYSSTLRYIAKWNSQMGSWNPPFKITEI